VKLLKLTMPRVLVLGTNERDLSPVAASVAGLSHFVTSAWDADSLAEAVAKGSPEVIILDLRGGESALAAERDLIGNYDQVAEAPRLAIVESADVEELQSKYVSDFILDPYDISELAVRITRLLHKATASRGGKMLSADGLEIDTESFEVSVDGRQLSLTFKEFELLRFLAAHPGRVHTREALLNQVWGYDYFGGLRTVDVHIRRIRAKLGLRHENLIQTVHGVGYKFTA
jgi:DNA-binding response OmpR family regulator